VAWDAQHVTLAQSEQNVMCGVTYEVFATAGRT
jgi:hypothetical protein